MKFRNVNMAEIATRKAGVRKMIQQFYDSGIDVVEVTDWEDTYKSLLSAYQSLRDQAYYMSRHGCKVRVKRKEGKMYLIREE